MPSTRHALRCLVLLLLAFPSSGQKLGPGKAAPKPATPAGETTAKKSPALAGLRSTKSPAADNEAAENDPHFDPVAWLKRGKAPSSTASAMLRLADHPKRDELARFIVDSIRGREIDVAILGGEKYMINDCLGVKASAGTFRLKLENPTVRFEDTGLVVKFEIDHVSLSALKIRIRPNPNVLEPCKFSKKFEVGGSMKDVKLTLRLDPMYDLERCRIGKWSDLNPEVRIGNLNLKPLQNDLDRMAKNMVEDALTIALQFEIDGFYSALGELMCSAIDQFLEADCPTHAGDTAKAIGGIAKTVGLGGKGSGSGSGSGSSGGAPAASAGSGVYDEADVAALLARIEDLERRIFELEEARTAQPPGVQPSGAQPSGAQPSGVQTSGATLLVPNAELKGRMGRVVVRFADPELASSTAVALKRDDKKVGDTYGEASWELIPGTYSVEVSRVPVPGCEVKKGYDTVVRTGVLHVELTGKSNWAVYPKGGGPKVFDSYGTAAVGLPVGTYEVEIQGQRESVVVRENEVTRF